VTKLIYHVPTAAAGDVSPFDEAILQVAQAGPLKVVSPYIGVGYLKRILSASQEDWHLLSDVKAWLASLSVQARPHAWAFIRANLSRIHHCAAIHAKTVIGQRHAYVGSANLTSTGVLARTEMGVLLEDSALVAELHQWFDEIWSQTAPPIVDKTNEYVKQLDQNALLCLGLSTTGMSLNSSNRIVRARLAKEITRPSTQPALDLSQVAKELVTVKTAEQQNLVKTLGTVIEGIPDSGASFAAIFHSVQATTKTARRDVYLALLPYCANRVQTVFAADTINRFIYMDGVFVPSERLLLEKALAPFDAFLAVLIHHLDFEDERLLPTADLAKHSGVPPSKQGYLIRSLLQGGLLEQREDGGFVLAEGYVWPTRFKLFVKALAQWVARRERLGRPDAPPPPLPPPTPIRAGEPKPVVRQGVPTTIASTKPVGDASKGMSGSDLKVRINRADKVYWDLVTLISREGASLRYPSLSDLARRLLADSAERQSVIEQVLTGSFEGAPQLFTITSVDGVCIVRLAANAALGLKQAPNTSRALSLLRRELHAELEGHPVTRGAFDLHEHQVTKESQRLIKAADLIYLKFIQLLHDKPEIILASTKISDVARAIELVGGGQLVDIIAVLGGRAKGLPRLFKLEFVTTRKKGVRCKVKRQFVQDESLANLPMTKKMLSGLRMQRAPDINSRIADKRREVQPEKLAANRSAQPSERKPPPSSSTRKITLRQTLYREIEAKDSFGRKRIIGVTVHKRPRFVAKKDIE